MYVCMGSIFLVPSCGRILKLVHLRSYNTKLAAEKPLFCSPKSGITAQDGGFSLAHRLLCVLPVYQNSHSLLQKCTERKPAIEQGKVLLGTWELGCLWVTWGESVGEAFPTTISGDCVHNAVSKNHVSLMSSESLICRFLYLFLSQRCSSSILWDQMLWERKESLQQLPTQLRKPNIYSLDLSLLCRSNHKLPNLALSCAALEERSCSQKSSCSAYPFWCCCWWWWFCLFVSCSVFYLFVCFCLFLHGSGGTSLLETIAHKWPPKSVLCCLSMTTARMG